MLEILSEVILMHQRGKHVVGACAPFPMRYFGKEKYEAVFYRCL